MQFYSGKLSDSFLPFKESTWCHHINGFVGPTAGMERVVKRSLLVLGIKLSPSYPSCRLVIILCELS